MIEEKDGSTLTDTYTAVSGTYALEVEGLDLCLSITCLHLVLCF